MPLGQPRRRASGVATVTLLQVCALGLSAVVGFAAHRASLCTVKAAAEVIDSGTAHLFGAFARAALWATAVAGVFGILAPIMPQTPVAGSAPLALAGGFVFGIGAALNGGCSLSTVQRLIDGELSMLVTLLGLVAGVSLGLAFIVNADIPAAPMRVVPWTTRPAWANVLLLGLLLWCGREGVRLLRAPMVGTLMARLRQPTYHPASAAALMGVAAGTLYPLQGAWTYTNFVRSEAGAWLGTALPPSGFHALLVASVLVGMLISARQRNAFHLRTAPAAVYVRAACGGALMGIGVALIPGGNDTLLLAAIPALSPWAMPTYLALVGGVTVTMLGMRAVKRAPFARVRWRADSCDYASHASIEDKRDRPEDC